MANVNCEACEELRQTDPNMIVNGWSDSECTSMKNDTGLVASKGHNDCQDLEDMNDCMVGNLDAEIDKYEVCDWKKFMHKFIPNLWTLESAIICAICGIWTNIHSLWSKIGEILNELSQLWQKVNQILGNITNINNWQTRVNCQIDKLTSVRSIYIDGLTSATLGLGVQWRTSGTGHDELPTMMGNAYVLRINGSLKFTGSKWLNFTGNTDDGNWLVYRYKINKAQYGILNMWSDIMMSNNAAHITGYAQVYGAGETTPGYWGWDDPNGAEVVPDGYIYVDIRVSNIQSWGIASNTGNVTLTGSVPILTNIEALC